MNSKINAMRALAAYSARQSLRIVTFIFTNVAIIFTIGIGLLAYFFSPWWLVLLLPVGVILFIFLIIRTVVKKLISSIHRHPFTRQQREELEKFTGKLKGLAEIQNTPVFIFAVLMLWKLIRHRDESPMQQLVDASKLLKEDFATLERHFGER